MHYQSENFMLAITAQQKARTLQMKVLGMPMGDVSSVPAERRIAAE
jgi:hypothetical protein